MSKFLHKIAVLGTGYVGLTTGTCLAHLGHQVVCVDNDLKKLVSPEHADSGFVTLLNTFVSESL